MVSEMEVIINITHTRLNNYFRKLNYASYLFVRLIINAFSYTLRYYKLIFSLQMYLRINLIILYE